MSSPFDAAMAAADHVVSGVFGEDILITPRIERGKLGFTPDPDRSPCTVTGVFTLTASTGRFGGARQGTELQGMSTLALAPASAWFSAESLAAVGYVPGNPDLITLVGRPGQPSYAIAKRGPSDLDDQTFPLTRER